MPDRMGNAINLADARIAQRLISVELWLAEFEDPDGNHLALMSEVAMSGA